MSIGVAAAGVSVNTSEPDVRVHFAQPAARVAVLLGPEELVNGQQRVLRLGHRPRGAARPEPPVHALPELDQALRHHVARAVLELLRPDERAHVRPRGRRFAHHAAHGCHALAASLAQSLVELVRHHVVADHVARGQPAVAAAAAEPRGHLVGRGLPPDPLERVGVHQLGHRAR